VLLINTGSFASTTTHEDEDTRRRCWNVLNHIISVRTAHNNAAQKVHFKTAKEPV